MYTFKNGAAVAFFVLTCIYLITLFGGVVFFPSAGRGDIVTEKTTELGRKIITGDGAKRVRVPRKPAARCTIAATVAVPCYILVLVVLVFLVCVCVCVCLCVHACVLVFGK